MNQNYNYYQQSPISRSSKSLIDVLIQIENKYKFDFSFFKDKINNNFYKSIKAFQEEFLLYIHKIIGSNGTRNDMKKTLNELMNFEISMIQQYKEQFKEFNKKYDEQLYNPQTKYYNQQQTAINNVNIINQSFVQNNETNIIKTNNSNIEHTHSTPNVPSLGTILPLSNVNSLNNQNNNDNNNNNNSNRIYKIASYTNYGPFTSFGPIYDLSESSLSTLEISTIEPYLYNNDNGKNINDSNCNKKLNSFNSDGNSESNASLEQNIEINNKEIEEWEKMGINLESICQNFKINYKKNDTTGSNENKNINEKIADISQLLKQLYECQENRKNRKFYQTEISVDEKELAQKIESQLNNIIKYIPPSQLISKSNIKYAMDSIQHYEPWYQGVLTYDNGSSTGSNSNMNRYSRNRK